MGSDNNNDHKTRELFHGCSDRHEEVVPIELGTVLYVGRLTGCRKGSKLLQTSKNKTGYGSKDRERESLNLKGAVYMYTLNPALFTF